MKKIVFTLILLIIIILVILLMLNKNKTEIDTEKIQVVVSNFASYDFFRAIIGETKEVELKFLLGPGKQMHSYDPTAQDLITIQNADLFVYVGEEAEQWSTKVIEALNTDKTKIICISNYVNKLKEEKIEGAEDDHNHDHNEHEEGAFNEHVWTSCTNAIKIVEELEKVMEEIDANNKDTYKRNSENYIQEIKNIKDDIQKIVDLRRRDRLVFGDKMPMQYFIEEFGLEVSSAFNGCSTETDPSSSTIAYLVKKIKEEQIPVVLYCELNDGKVAKIIANEAGENVIPLQIQTLHNISEEDFKNGETWVSLMRRNLKVLEKALY